MPERTRRATNQHPHGASEFLRHVQRIAELSSQEALPVGDLLHGAGVRLYGLALLVFALPEAIPFPAVGLTGLIAIPVAAVAASMIIWGGQGELPAWILRRRIKRTWAMSIAEKGAGFVRRLERVSYPRLVALTGFARPLGLLCLCLSVVMATPVPFSNVPPGVTVVVIGLGIFLRDGLLVLVGVVAGMAILAAVVVLLVLGGGWLADGALAP